MRIRITKRPDSSEFAEFNVRHFDVGAVFDVAPRLATLLIVAGNAEPVVSPSERSEAADRSTPRSRKDDPQFS